MTVIEGEKLIETLQSEIRQGQDVEFNRNWLKPLRKSVLYAKIRGLHKALKNPNQ